MQTETEALSRQIGLSVPVWKIPICRYLGLRGYKFCIDFGTENARDIAKAHREREREQKTTYLRKDQAACSNF